MKSKAFTAKLGKVMADVFSSLHVRSGLIRIMFTLIGMVCAVPFGLLAAEKTPDLLAACLDTRASSLPAGLNCAYLKHVRSPDPNSVQSTPLDTGSRRSGPQSFFGQIVLSYDPENARSVDLVEHFMNEGVDWEKSCDKGLPPLHLAILFAHDELVKRFLEAGAKPSTQTGHRHFLGQDALAFLATLKSGEKDKGFQGKIGESLARIEKLLLEAR